MFNRNQEQQQQRNATSGRREGGEEAAAARATTTVSSPALKSESCCMNPLICCSNSSSLPSADDDYHHNQRKRLKQPLRSLYHHKQQHKNKRLKKSAGDFSSNSSKKTTNANDDPRSNIANGMSDLNLQQHEDEEETEKEDSGEGNDDEEDDEACEDFKHLGDTTTQPDVVETTEFINQKLQEMNYALDNNTNNLTTRKLRDYQKALFLWPKLKTNIEFKLMFLRADDYDGVKAAKRLVNFYVQKREIFGEGKIVKKITIDDLSQQDIDLLKSGFMTQLPYNDANDRPVLYANLSQLDFNTVSVDSILRVTFYVSMVTLTESEVSQRNGMCAVARISSTIDWTSFAQIIPKLNNLVENCVPQKTGAFHPFFHSSDGAYWTMKYLPLVVGSSARFRLHYGSDIEIEYDLLSFGIKLDGLLREETAGDKSVFHDYVAYRTEIDNQNTQRDYERAIRLGYVEHPLPSDTIMGRGRPYREWVGNRLWNAIVDQYVGTYKTTESRFDKICTSLHVVEDFKALSNSRFLLESATVRQQRDGAAAGGDHEGAGWRILDLNGDDAKRKASYSLQNRAKLLARSAAAAPVDGPPRG